MIIKSHAKINIVLNIKGRYNEHLHDIDIISLPLELHDSLQISKINDSNSYVTFANIAIGGDDNNLATKALCAFKKKYNIDTNYRILINKTIPISAGLGGGSSNAAATLRGISVLSKTRVSDEELAEIGFTLGSDVPFFIYGKPARIMGGGEIVKPITVKNTYYCLIVKPKTGLSTTMMYKKSDEFNLPTYNIDNVIKALEEGDDELLANNIGNVLEYPAINELPEIETIKTRLKNEGFKIVLMSGSGSSVFALSTNKKHIKKVFKKLIKENYKNTIELTKIIN